MNSKAKFLCAAMVLVVGGLAWAQTPVDKPDTRDLVGQVCYNTSGSRTATAYYYGPVLSSYKANELDFNILVGSGCGATTKVQTFVEWLHGDPSSSLSEHKGPYTGVTYTAGKALSGVWTLRENLSVTSAGAQVAGVDVPFSFRRGYITASSNWYSSATVRAPYFRFCVYYAVADSDECKVTAHAARKY